MRPRQLGGRLVGFLPLFLCLSACSGPSSPSTNGPLALMRFGTASTAFLMFGGYDSPQTLVVHDRDTWLRTWTDINRRLIPAPPPPDIDFSTEMVLVAALGTRSSSGFDIVFTGASEANGLVTVEVESRSPGAKCVTLPVITAPLDLARVPRRNGSVVFHTTPTVIDCP
jgi:hypothetical protein